MRHDATYFLPDEPHVLSSSDHGIHSHLSMSKKHQVADQRLDGQESIGESARSASARTSDVNSEGASLYTPTLREESPRESRSSRLSINPLPMPDRTQYYRDHSTDSDRGSSLLQGTSFDTLLNSLKSMRDKDLDSIVRNKNESLIDVHE